MFSSTVLRRTASTASKSFSRFSLAQNVTNKNNLWLTFHRSFSTKYAPSHEYIKVEGGVGTIGITDFAQKALGDVVYVDLPSVGDEFDKGDSFGSVESVKAASDVYLPVSGEIIAINEELSDDTSLVNSSPEEKAWFVKIKMKDEGEVGELLDESAYKNHCDSSD